MNYTTVFKHCVFSSVISLSLFSADSTGHTRHHTALDEYIQQTDENYSYQLVGNKQLDGYRVETTDMNSLKWRSEEEVDRTLWQHQLITIVPDKLTHKNALIWISGGRNPADPAKKHSDRLAQIAVATQSMVTEVRTIPNQSIKFSDEKDPRYQQTGRKEDELIAYAWDKYLTTKDASWLPRLPMTKSVVKAMDTIQRQHPSIEGFVVAGASKRGWTAWTTAAVDNRVIAVAPLVIDVPNVVATMQHHNNVYGYWSDAVHDYEEMGILDRLQSKAFKTMMQIVDPYYYFDRLKMPKYIVNSTGDQFFLPDSSQFYFNALKKEKLLRYVPNTNHSLNAEATKDFTAFYYSILNNQQRPRYSWKKHGNGTLTIKTSTEPSAVRLWQANNPQKRNFRLDTIGKAWTSRPLPAAKKGEYIAKVKAPDSGWTAFMVELEYPSDGPFPFRVTTEVSVISGNKHYTGKIH